MKRVCLGTAVRNEAYFLPKTFPLFIKAFDGIIACDNGSTDETKSILTNMGATVIDGNYDDLVLTARNKIIPVAEKLGYDAMILIDADEVITFEGITLIRQYLESEEFLMFPRIEFVKDFDHFDPNFYPDVQGRAWHLNKGYKWVGEIHEFLHKGDDPVNAMNQHLGILLPDCPIYHYGKCDSAEDLYIKYTNYELRANGLEPIKKVPDGVKIDPAKYWGTVKEFKGDHPLKGVKM